MKGMRRWKNLAIAAVLGLVIGVQSVVPVQAEEAVPMALVKCSRCGTAMNVDIQKSKTGAERGPVAKCNQADHHLTDCWLFEAQYVIYESYLCPNSSCRHSEKISTNYVWETFHRSVSR